MEHLSAEEEEEEDPCTQKSSSLYPEENYKETKAMPEEAVIAVTKVFSSTVKGNVIYGKTPCDRLELDI